MDFGNRLKILLEIKDIKHKDFAAFLSISPSTLNGYLNRGKQPNFELLKKIASLLDVTTDYLLDYNISPQFQPMSVKELNIIAKLRKMGKTERNVIFYLVDRLHTSQAGEKNPINDKFP